MISILHYLYRKSRNWAIAVMFVSLLLSGFSLAQLRDRTEHPRVDQGQPEKDKKPDKNRPRAIAVLEFLPGGAARLVPVALWINDRFYDASLYGSNPEPMALQPETLYQALNYGEPTGWFTVTTPRQVNGNWIADGHWKPQKGSLDTKIADQAAKQSKKKGPSLMGDDSGPPVLRRAPSSSSSEPEPSSGSQSSTPASSSGSSTSSSSSTPSPPPSNDDPGRPTLKNSTPSSSTTSPRPTLSENTPPASAPPAPASSPDENDPDRPVLHRGKPTTLSGTSSTATAAPKPDASKPASPAAAVLALKASASAPAPPSPGRAYPAISDASNYQGRSLLYPLTPAEKGDKAQPMLALAMEEVRKFANKGTAPAPAKAPVKAPAKASTKAPTRPQSFVITDYDLRAFDLDFSSSPTLVLTAKVPSTAAKPAGTGEFDYFVTVVARLDPEGKAQEIFSSVTDSTHLDAFPRLEIIDAVDADANGRGDLLFRQHSDTSISYSLYRVYPYQMVKVFEGGAGM